jgi:hypothetical protein
MQEDENKVNNINCLLGSDSANIREFFFKWAMEIEAKQLKCELVSSKSVMGSRFSKKIKKCFTANYCSFVFLHFWKSCHVSCICDVTVFLLVHSDLVFYFCFLSLSGQFILYIQYLEMSVYTLWGRMRTMNLLVRILWTNL